MSFEFYLGLVAAIPIGILTWIIQRRIEPFLNRRAERSLRSKISSLERELEFTRSIKNSIGINTFILETLLLIALVGAAGSIVTSFLYGFPVCLNDVYGGVGYTRGYERRLSVQ
jgi:hypothetical protein